MLIILLRLKTLRQSFNLLNYPEQGSLTRDKLNKKNDEHLINCGYSLLMDVFVKHL